MSTSYGLGSGSAISAANAAMGQSMSNGNTFTGNEFEEKLLIKIFNAAYSKLKIIHTEKYIILIHIY